jgi:hypothetical protein
MGVGAQSWGCPLSFIAALSGNVTEELIGEEDEFISRAAKS